MPEIRPLARKKGAGESPYPFHLMPPKMRRKYRAKHRGGTYRYTPMPLPPSADVDLTAEVYRKDVVFRVRPRGCFKRHQPPHIRSEIKGFSKASARRLKFTVRNTADMWSVFLTLTYPASYPSDGRVCKRHLHTLCTWLSREVKGCRRNCKKPRCIMRGYHDVPKPKLAYIWVLEFQERGAPHFHFTLNGRIPKEVISRRWAEIVDSGDPDHVRAGTRIEALTGGPEQIGKYMSKYAAKLTDQKEVPESFEHVGRFWGASRVLEKVCYRVEDTYQAASTAIRPLRKMFGAACRGWGYKWRWKGYGFILLNGADDFMSHLLRQAVLIDSGRDLWRDWTDGDGRRWLRKKHYDGTVEEIRYVPKWLPWNGRPIERPKFVTLAEQMKNEGQFDFFRGFIPAYPDLWKSDADDEMKLDAKYEKYLERLARSRSS